MLVKTRAWQGLDDKQTVWPANCLYTKALKPYIKNLSVCLWLLFHLFLFLIFWTQNVCLCSPLRVVKITIYLTGTKAVVSELFRLLTKTFARIATNWIKSVILPGSVAWNHKMTSHINYFVEIKMIISDLNVSNSDELWPFIHVYIH